MRRICFTLQIDPGRIDEYRRRHAAVWPEMLVALRDEVFNLDDQLGALP